MDFTIEELIKLAYSIECRYGMNDELAEKIYTYLEEVTGKDYRIINLIMQ
jgi:hypothetical protein